MKKIILSVLLSTGLFAELATVDCTEMNKIFNLMQGITKVCQVETDIHTFTQKISVNVAGIIVYENGEEMPFTTLNNTFNANIEADRPFVFKVGEFVSNKFKLSILSTGKESWKFFYTFTSRWRKYDFSEINVTPISKAFTSARIIYEDKSPATGIRVQMITSHNVYESITDDTGTFKSLVDVNLIFMFRAYNEDFGDWASYANKMRITEDLQTQEDINGTWVNTSKDFFIIERI